MPADDIIQAFKIWQDAVSTKNAQSAFMQATDAAKQINQSQLAEHEKQTQRQMLGDQLAGYLAMTGQTGQAAALAANAIQTPKVDNASSIESVLLNRENYSPEKVKQAEDLNAQNQKFALEKEDRSLTRALTIAEAGTKGRKSLLEQKSADDLARDAARAALEAKNRLERPLPPPIVNKLTDLDNNVSEANILRRKFEANPKITGLKNLSFFGEVKGKIDPEFASFKSDTNRLFDSYRRVITGMAASESELQRLEASYPMPSDTPAVFRAKLQSVQDLAARVKTRYLQGLKKSRYIVDDWETDTGGNDIPGTSLNNTSIGGGLDLNSVLGPRRK